MPAAAMSADAVEIQLSLPEICSAVRRILSTATTTATATATATTGSSWSLAGLSKLQDSDISSTGFFRQKPPFGLSRGLAGLRDRCASPRA
jgi:hypothetical protein